MAPSRLAERYRGIVRTIGHQRWFARMGRAVVPLDRAIQRRTGGRFTVLGTQVLPQLLLTTSGRTSGLPRTVPLLYAERPRGGGSDYVVVASNWGQQHHPAWSANLIANPEATVQVRGRSIAVTARLTEGAEREELWASVVRIWPAYDTYADRSGRTLRVFLLRPTRP